MPLACFIARDGRLGDLLGAACRVLREQGRLAHCGAGAVGSVKFSDTKGHERVSADPKEKGNKKLQVLPRGNSCTEMEQQKRPVTG